MTDSSQSKHRKRESPATVPVMDGPSPGIDCAETPLPRTTTTDLPGPDSARAHKASESGRAVDGAVPSPASTAVNRHPVSVAPDALDPVNDEPDWADEPDSSGLADDANAYAERNWPTSAELFSFRNQLYWIIGFWESWFFSRQVRGLILGIPFVVAVILALLLQTWMRYEDEDVVIRRYETAYIQSVEEDDPQSQILLLRALIDKRPNHVPYKFQLAIYEFEQGQPTTGLARMMQIAPQDGTGFAPAHIWLVRQSMSPDAPLELTTNQQISHLMAALRSDSEHVEANALLGSLYMSVEQFSLAEEHLRRAAAAEPEFLLELSKVQLRLGNRDAALDSAKRAAEKLQTQSVLSPESALATIRWAEALRASGQIEPAEKMLQEAIARKEADGGDSSVLRQAIGDFYVSLADERAASDFRYRDSALSIALRALEWDSENASALATISRLAASGSKIPRSIASQLVDFWKKQCAHQDTARNHLRYSQALSLVGDTDEAVTQMELAYQRDESLQLYMAQVYIFSGQTTKGRELAEKVTESAREQLAERPDDLDIRMALADALILVEDRRQAEATLMNGLTIEELPEDPRVRNRLGTLWLAEYDRELRHVDPPPDYGVAMESLLKARQLNPLNLRVLERLAALNAGDSDVAEQAGEILREMLANGEESEEILNLMGTSALEAEDYTAARQHLEQALGLNPRNAMVLNNLAIVLIRSTNDASPARALTLIDTALEEIPGQPQMLSTRAEILLVLQRNGEALRDLQRALPFLRTSRKLHELLAEAYRRTNQPDMADRHAGIAAELAKQSDRTEPDADQSE